MSSAASGYRWGFCVLCVIVLAPVAVAQEERPNVLFLFTDDQRFDTIHALGNDAIHTPNLDRLVNQGTVFTRTFIQGSQSGAVCLPSRAMLLTGQSLFRTPLQPKADGGVALMPEVFREAGYTTFGTGKWHNGKAAYARCFTRGGSIFFGGMHRLEVGGHETPHVFDFDPEGKYPESEKERVFRFSSDLFADEASRFLRTYDGDAPFFCYVSFSAPHDPRTPPQDAAEWYEPEELEVPPNFLPEHPFDNGELRIRDEQLAPWPRTREIVREHLAEYYGMITHLDAAIGRILQTLEYRGFAENTIIVFAGDNGLAVGQHGLLGKQSLYEHSVRVPLVFVGPDIPAGSRIDELVYLHDVFPTLCDLAGLPIPDTVESKSLAPLLRGESEDGRDSVFAAYKDVQRMVRNDRYKLIHYPNVGVTQLFDLENDPWEQQNRSGEAEYEEIADELWQSLFEWQEQTGDPLQFAAFLDAIS